MTSASTDVGAGELAHQESQHDAGHRCRSPAGREHRVGHDQLVPGNDVRKRRAQAGQDETVGRQHGQRRREQRRARPPPATRPATSTTSAARTTLATQQHLPTSPPVQHHARERPDQRVRQQQDREGLRRRRRRGVALGREEHVRRHRDLEDAVAELPAHADREEPPKAAATQHGAQIRDEPAGQAHYGSLGGRQQRRRVRRQPCRTIAIACSTSGRARSSPTRVRERR